ncbi:MAG TPA: hypothetical protein VGE85_11570 [Terracidiphilus sp.]|jgi:hypothetical protein
MQGYIDNTLGAFHGGGGSRGGGRYTGPGGIHIGNRAGRLAVFHGGRGFGGHGIGGHGYGGRGFGGRGFWRNMSAARLRALHFMRQQMLNSQYGADGGGSGGGGSTNGGGSTGGSDADSGGISLQQLQQEIEQLEQALQSQGSQPGGQPDATVQPGGQPAAVGSNDPGGQGAYHFGGGYGGPRYGARLAGRREEHPGFNYERRRFEIHPGYPGFIPPRRHIDWGAIFGRGLDLGVKALEELHPHPAAPVSADGLTGCWQDYEKRRDGWWGRGWYGHGWRERR